MKASDIDKTLVDGYMQLLDNLSQDTKLDLISRLTLSVETDIDQKKGAFYEAFGAWDSIETADEMIAEIRGSRTFNRQIEQL